MEMLKEENHLKTKDNDTHKTLKPEVSLSLISAWI